MATSKMHEAFTYARNAGADLSDKLHYFAKIDTDGDLVLCGDGQAVAGVIHEACAQDEVASIYFGAIGKVITAEQITAGAILASDGSGKAVAAAVGDYVAGIALETTAAGGLVPFIFASGRRHG